jgi:hypothetical protein
VKIQKVFQSRMRNGEHAQFYTEVNDLMVRITPAVLGIDTLYPEFQSALDDEFEAVNLIKKSALTDELELADQPRDVLYRGLCETVKGALKHYNPEVQQAAAKVMVALQTPRNMDSLPYDEETLALKKLNKELTTFYTTEMATLGIEQWVLELMAKNDAFDQLMKRRYNEVSQKTTLRMKSIRLELHAAFQKLIVRIEALIELNGDANHAGFVAELNTIVQRYNNAVLRREGHNDDEEGETPPPNN